MLLITSLHGLALFSISMDRHGLISFLAVSFIYAVRLSRLF